MSSLLSKESQQKWEDCLEEAHMMVSCSGRKVGLEDYYILPIPMFRVVQFAKAAGTAYHKLGALNSRNLPSRHSHHGRKS